MKIALLSLLLSAPMGAVVAQNASLPAKPAAVALFPGGDLHQQIAQLTVAAKEKGSSGATLADDGGYRIQLSVRTRSGGAEVHAHWDDVMMVRQGHATLITGGTVVGGHTQPDGETLGTRIEGGDSHPLAPGDVFTVRAGTPHQTVLAPGTTYAALVIKIHEP